MTTSFDYLATLLSLQRDFKKLQDRLQLSITAASQGLPTVQVEKPKQVGEKRIDPVRDEQMMEMLDKGMQRAAIAKHFGCGKTSVQRCIRRRAQAGDPRALKLAERVNIRQVLQAQKAVEKPKEEKPADPEEDLPKQVPHGEGESYRTTKSGYRVPIQGRVEPAEVPYVKRQEVEHKPYHYDDPFYRPVIDPEYPPEDALAKVDPMQMKIAGPNGTIRVSPGVTKILQWLTNGDIVDLNVIAKAAWFPNGDYAMRALDAHKHHLEGVGLRVERVGKLDVKLVRR